MSENETLHFGTANLAWWSISSANLHGTIFIGMVQMVGACLCLFWVGVVENSCGDGAWSATCETQRVKPPVLWVAWRRGRCLKNGFSFELCHRGCFDCSTCTRAIWAILALFISLPMFTRSKSSDFWWSKCLWNTTIWPKPTLTRTNMLHCICYATDSTGVAPWIPLDQGGRMNYAALHAPCWGFSHRQRNLGPQ